VTSRKKLYITNYSFAKLTIILLLHYLVRCGSHSSAVYDNEFILGSACIGLENHRKTTKALKICQLYITDCSWTVTMTEERQIYG